MTKLEAINTILIYINETPLDALNSGLPIESLADTVLQENIRIVNSSLSSSITDTTLGSFPLLEDYIVKRAGRSLYARVIGANGENLDVLILDEKQALGNVKKHIIDNTFESAYAPYKTDIIGFMSSSTNIEESSILAIEIKNRLDSIPEPTYMSDIDKIDYKILVYRLDRDSQVSQAELNLLLKRYSLYSLPNKNIQYFKTYAMQILANATSKQEVDYMLDSIEDDILAIVPPSSLTAQEQNEYKLAILTNNTDSIAKLLNKVRLSTLSSLFTDDKYKYFTSFVLERLKGTTLEEIEDEVGVWKYTLDNLVSTDNKSKMAELNLMYGNKLPNDEQVRLAKIVALNYLKEKTTILYFKNYILTLCDNVTSVEEVINIVDSIEDSINEQYNLIYNKYNSIDVRLINEYILYILLNDEKKYYTVISMAKQVINSYTDITDIEKRLMYDILLDSNHIKDINDIDNFKVLVINTIDSSRKKILGYGWNFNTLIINLYPNNENNILIPKSMLSAKSSSKNNYSVIDWKLFDNDTKTFIFSNSVELVIVQDFNYDDIINPILDYIYYDALYKISIVVGSKQDYRANLVEAKYLALRHDADISSTNILDSDYTVDLLNMSSL